MMKFVLALAMLASASATTTTNFAVVRTGTYATAASAAVAGKLQIKFTNGAQITSGDSAGIVFTAKKPTDAFDLFTAAGTDKDISAGVTLKNAADATIQLTSVTLKADKSIVVVPGEAVPAATYTLEFPDTNIAANPTVDGATADNNNIKFDFKTAPDTALTAQTGYTINDGKATWGSAARTSYIAGTASANAGDLTIKFTPKNALAGTGTIKLKASNAAGVTDKVFGAVGNKACTVKVGTADLASTTPSEIAVDNNNLLSIKLGSTGLDANTEATIVCARANLAAIPALDTSTAGNNVYTFSIETTSDIVPLTAQIGYTVTGSSVTWGSATRSSLLAGVNGTLIFEFTPTVGLTASDTITLTASQAIFKLPNSPVACAVTAVADLASSATKPAFVAATTKSDANKKMLTLTLAAANTDVVPDKKKATVECTSNLVAAAGHTHVYFDIKTAKDVQALTNQTGYTIKLAPTPTPTAAATPATTTANSNSTVAAASTTSVNMITIVALAAVALRQ